MKFRRLNQFIAFAGGYFWLPCPECGQEFGGHEWKMRMDKPIANSKGNGICPDCEEEMTLHAMPVEHSRALFGVEFIIRRWVKQPWCEECETERHTRGHRMAEESAYEAGRMKGYEDSQERRHGW